MLDKHVTLKTSISSGASTFEKITIIDPGKPHDAFLHALYPPSSIPRFLGGPAPDVLDDQYYELTHRTKEVAE